MKQIIVCFHFYFHITYWKILFPGKCTVFVVIVHSSNLSHNKLQQITGYTLEKSYSFQKWTNQIECDTNAMKVVMSATSNSCVVNIKHEWLYYWNTHKICNAMCKQATSKIEDFVTKSWCILSNSITWTVIVKIDERSERSIQVKMRCYIKERKRKMEKKARTGKLYIRDMLCASTQLWASSMILASKVKKWIEIEKKEKYFTSCYRNVNDFHPSSYESTRIPKPWEIIIKSNNKQKLRFFDFNRMIIKSWHKRKKTFIHVQFFSIPLCVVAVAVCFRYDCVD